MRVVLWTCRWLGEILWLGAWFLILRMLMAPLPVVASPWAWGALCLVVLLCGTWLVTLVHECGHLMTCLALGVKVRGFHVGTTGQGTLRFRVHGVPVTLGPGRGGRVEHGPVSAARRQAMITAAGPLISLVAGAALYAVARGLPSPFSRPAVMSLAVLFATSGAYNLLPFRARTRRLSDGARLLALGGGRLARALRTEEMTIRDPNGVTWRPASLDEAAQYKRDVAILRQFASTPGARLAPELTDRYLAAFRDQTVTGLLTAHVVARALRQEGRIGELLELFEWYPLLDRPALPITHSMHGLTYQVILLPRLPRPIVDLAAERMDCVLDDYDASTTLPDGVEDAALHTMAVVHLRQGNFGAVEELCQEALTSPQVSPANRATVLATVALARKALGCPYDRLLAEAVALAPEADLVAEATGWRPTHATG